MRRVRRGRNVCAREANIDLRSTAKRGCWMATRMPASRRVVAVMGMRLAEVKVCAIGPRMPVRQRGMAAIRRRGAMRSVIRRTLAGVDCRSRPDTAMQLRSLG